MFDSLKDMEARAKGLANAAADLSWCQQHVARLEQELESCRGQLPALTAAMEAAKAALGLPVDAKDDGAVNRERWIDPEHWRRASSSRSGRILSSPWVGICSNQGEPISVVSLSPVVPGGERFASYFEMSTVEALLEFLETLRADCPVTVACDRWRNVDAADAMHQAGINVVKMPITVANLSEPTLCVKEAVQNGLLVHDGSPVLAEHVGTVLLKRVPRDAVFPVKPLGGGSINGALALVMAMRLALDSERQLAGDTAAEVSRGD